MTSFSVSMAWRETRAGWRHFVYFLVCIALGVGALVCVGLFASTLERTVTREARALLGGDVEIRLTHSLSDQGQQVVQTLRHRGIGSTHVSELVAMAARVGNDSGTQRIRPSGHPTQVVELKAIEERYPLYGTLNTAPTLPILELLAPPRTACAGPPCYGAIVQEALLIKMGLAVGHTLKIGQAFFTITGILRHEPDRMASAFSLGPRVIISRDGLAAAKLIQPGSRVRERYLLRLPATLLPLPVAAELRGALDDESARVSTYRDAQPQLKRFLNQLTRYLGLVGLTALFVGGIGVASTVHAFLQEKLKAIAILKTLGADSGTIIQTYVLQALALSFIGSLAGVALGVVVQQFIPALLTNLVPVDLLDLTVGHTTLSSAPIAKGLVLGMATTLLFTLWPLLSVREIPPALIFRTEGAAHDLTPKRRAWTEALTRLSRDRIRWTTALTILFGLAGLAVWQAGSVTIGLLFISALLVAVILLRTAAALLVYALTLAPVPRSIAIRHAMRNLHRPGSHTAGIMVAIGIGAMIIVTISLLERALVRQVGESRPAEAPTFFFIDIQPDQLEPFQTLLEDRLAGRRAEMTPLVRSRLHAISGTLIIPDEESPRGQGRGRERGEHGKSWYATREYVLTFLDRLPKDNRIVKGDWWAHGERPQRPLVSIEEEAAKHLGVGLGSIIEFDIQGTTLAAEVSNIRNVEWGNFSTNFYMILSPGSLEGAPFTYVATVRVAREGEVSLQEAVVASFPNVTAINIGEVMDSFARILEHLSSAIRTIALVCVLAGAVVMAAALATTRYRRLYESVVLKALGATRFMIAGSFAAEYVLMGAVAGFIGILLGSALSWGVLHFVFDMPWSLQPRVLSAGFVLTILLTLAVGFLSTFRILGQRPLAILRHE